MGQGDMRKILFIVLESKSANGICTKAVMDECIRKGLEVYCLTNQEYNEKDEYFKDGIWYYTIKPRMYYKIDAYINNKVKDKKVQRILKFINSILGKIKLLLSYPTWPLISPMYTNRIYYKANQVCRNHMIDTIVPVYTQIDALIAAERIKKRYEYIQYIPYFLDSFSGGYGPKIFSQEWTIRRGLRWEAKLLPCANKIIMMRSAQSHYERYCVDTEYYKLIRFLDLPLFTPKQNIDIVDTLLEKDAINLLYVGSIPAHIRNPQYFLKMFRMIANNHLRLTIIGDSTCESLLKEMAREDNRIHLLPKVDHDIVLAAMEAADILVNLGNNNIHMTPSKIFEYMSFGKPILSTAPIRDEPSIKYLQYYPCKYIIDESIDIMHNARQVDEFIRSNYSRRVKSVELCENFYLNTPEAFVNCICEEE